MIRILTATLAAAFAAATLAHADGRISYTADAGDMGQMKMTERWRAGVLRMDIDGMDSYSLQRDDTIYAITTAGGQITVMDLGQMADHLADMPGAAEGQSMGPNATGVVFPESIEDIRDTDETREIAGITGGIHEIDWIDNQGSARTDTAVLSDDPRLLEHQALKMQFIRTISGDAPNPLMVELETRGLAALSFGDRFLVTEVSDAAGPAGDFELPAEPMDFGNMMSTGNQ